MSYVVHCHIKVAHISPEYGAYLNLDEEMIARNPIFDLKSNLKLNQETLDTVYLKYQCDTSKIDNALVYQILSKVFTDMGAYVNMIQRKSIKDSQAVFFDIHKGFLDHDHSLTMMVRGKGGIGTSMLHSTKNSKPSWRASQTMAIEEWTIAPKSATSSKASRALS